VAAWPEVEAVHFDCLLTHEEPTPHEVHVLSTHMLYRHSLSRSCEVLELQVLGAHLLHAEGLHLAEHEESTLQVLRGLGSHTTEIVLHLLAQGLLVHGEHKGGLRRDHKSLILLNLHV
jgi:hypothetical protein